MLFDQQANESAPAYAAFQAYLKMPVPRSIRRLGIQLQRADSRLFIWSRKHKWGLRVKAWNDHLQSQQTAAAEEAIRKETGKWMQRRGTLRDQEYEAGLELLEKAKQMLKFPLIRQEKVEQDGKTIIHIYPAKWDLNTATRCLDLADRLLRLSTGMPTSRAEVTGPDGGPVPVENVAGEISNEDLSRAVEIFRDQLRDEISRGTAEQATDNGTGSSAPANPEPAH